MSFSEFEIKRYEKAVQTLINKRRPPEQVRDKVDLGFELVDQSVEIFETRAHWQNPSEKIKQPIAKATYVKSKNLWKIYWMKSDLKWHEYEPEFKVGDLSEFVTIVDLDEHGYFWG